MRIIIVSGGFDPIHTGHIEYFKSAKNLGDKLLVALNSDYWLEMKKGKFFMPFEERKTIIESIRYVDEVIEFDDDKKGSCINALEKVKLLYPNDQIYFANGGDRNKKNIPEMVVSNINFIFGVGGDKKKNSSSWILSKWQNYFEEREWGSFFHLFQKKDVKVKELIINPDQKISFQRHFKRNEIWLVISGRCYVAYSNNNNLDDIKKIILNKFDYYIVKAKDWHQIINPFKEPVHIIEIQYGDECIEEDIERIKKL